MDSFYDWYDSLSSRDQARVDDLADDLGLPLYDDCSDAELATLHDCFVSNPKKSAPIPPGLPPVRASYDPTEADTYIVKIWYEVEPGFDTTAGPVAAEEIFEVVANSPDQAKEYARMQWDGPIDRIEIVDVNPDPSAYELPFEACSNVTANTSETGERKLSQASFDFAHDGYYSEDDIDRCIRLAFEDDDVTVEGTSYHEVDYSDYPEYDDFIVSQVDVDFS